MRNKYLFEKKVVENIGDLWKSTPLLSLTQKGVILKDINSGKGKTHSDYSTYQKINNNDLIFCLFDMDETPRTIGLSPYEGMITSAYSVFKTLAESEPKYIYYYYEHIDSFKGLKPFYTGLRKTVRPPTFLNVAMPMPSYAEQKNIANFLDKETTRIDTLIKKKTCFIELLKEKRKALISHVVTKGLSSDIEMKDSGVEWLGDVPAHWDISKLKYLGACQNGINIGGEFFGSGDPFISYGDVYNNKTLPAKVKGLVQSTDKDKILYSVQEGDVLFTRTSETVEEIGFSSVCKISVYNAVFAGFLIRFRPKSKTLDKDYSGYFFQNEKLRSFFTKEMNLVTRASLSQELLKRMPVLLPPNKEQSDIGSYLNHKTARIDLLLEKTSKSIELLKEHRTVLISAAVTGKIDVRNHTKNKNNNNKEVA